MFANSFNVLGTPPTPIVLTTSDWQKFLGRDSASAGTIQLPYPGQVVVGVDPIFGEASFILAFGVASLQIGDAVMIGAGYATTRQLAATRGVVGISMSANTNTAALSWFAVRGQVPARLAASAADAPLYGSATAGSLSNAVVSTNGVTGAFAMTALAATIGTKQVSTLNGSNLLAVSNIDGLYVGGGVTGTGIPASTTIAAIGYGGLMLGVSAPPVGFVQLSANATATGSVTGTFIHGAAFALVNLAHPVAANLG